MSQPDRNSDLLTKIEALEWQRTGQLPDDFAGRIENFIEFYECPNCGGVEDMNQVMRDWWAVGPSWCDYCVATDDEGERLTAEADA